MKFFNIFRNVLKPVDFIVTIILSPALFLYCIALFIYRKISKEPVNKRLALVGMGVDLEGIKEKYGDYNFIYEHNPDRYFEKVFIFWYPTRKSSMKQIRNDIFIVETKPLLTTFIYTGMIIFSFKVLYSIVKHRIAIIRSTNTCTHGLLAILVSKVAFIPNCISIHADYNKRFEIAGANEAPVIFGSRTLAKKLEHYVLRHAHMVLPIRESLISYATHYGAKNIRVIPHGIDLAHFEHHISYDEAEKYRKGMRVISSVSRLTRDNYIYDVIEIAEKIIERYNDVVFYIIGDGREYNLITLRIQKSCDRIKLLGFIEREKVIMYRRLSNVNLSLMGGFSLIEAVASGNPTIAYDVEWHNELIKNGETGYLVRENDINMVLKRIEELLCDEKRARRIGSAGKKAAFEKHDIRVANKIKINCYEELLKKSRKI